MKKGIFIGRFQPFHLGHSSAVRQCLEQVDFLVIGIGSTQKSHEEDNPFTADERQEMIRAALLEDQIPESRFDIVNIPDINDDAAWPAHVHKLAPEFEVVFTLSDIVKTLFEKYDHTPVIWLKKEIEISSTQVRKTIRQRGEWKNYLCPSTIHFLEKNKGVERIKAAALNP